MYLYMYVFIFTEPSIWTTLLQSSCISRLGSMYICMPTDRSIWTRFSNLASFGCAQALMYWYSLHVFVAISALMVCCRLSLHRIMSSIVSVWWNLLSPLATRAPWMLWPCSGLDIPWLAGVFAYKIYRACICISSLGGLVKLCFFQSSSRGQNYWMRCGSLFAFLFCMKPSTYWRRIFALGRPWHRPGPFCPQRALEIIVALFT